MSIIPVEMWADPDTGVVVDGDTQIQFHAENGRIQGVMLTRALGSAFASERQWVSCDPPIPFAVGDTVTFDPESREVKVVPAQTENRKPLTVGELIEEFGRFPQDMLVIQDGTSYGYEAVPQMVVDPQIARAWIYEEDGEYRVNSQTFAMAVGSHDDYMGTLTEVVWL